MYVVGLFHLWWTEHLIQGFEISRQTKHTILLMLTGRFLSCLVFCIFAFLLLLVEYFEYLIELQIFAGIVVGMFVVILCCSKFFYDLQVTTSKCTALHTTVGPHLCCDNWKGQRLCVFYSIYRANEVFHVWNIIIKNNFDNAMGNSNYYL